MKKQNILNLFCEDLELNLYEKRENFKKCINDYDKCINENIIPFLVVNQKMLGFKFDLNSNDKSIKEKSEFLLKIMIREFRGLVSVTPDYFLAIQEEEGFDEACSNMLLHVLLGSDITELFDAHKRLDSF